MQGKLRTFSRFKRRKEIWEAMHPNSGTTCPTIPERGRGRPEEFAASTSEITGEDKRTINRHVARAEALGDDLDKVAGTGVLFTLTVFLSVSF